MAVLIFTQDKNFTCNAGWQFYV